MSLSKLRKLLEKLVDEDYLNLDDRLVEIGVLSYLSQKGKLNHSREDKLRSHILEAVGNIKGVVLRWLTSHALYDEVIELGGSYQDVSRKYEDLYSELVTTIESYIIDDLDPTDGTLYKPSTLAGIISNNLGGERYFGSGACDEHALETLVAEHLETEEYEDDDGETSTSYFFDSNEDDIINFLIECKNTQVNNNGYFMDLVEDMVSSIKELEDNIDILDIGDLILKFDHLKDLNHANGNLLSDYGDVDWENVNERIEAKVRAIKESLDEKKHKKRRKSKNTIIKGYPSYFWNHDYDDGDSTDSDGGDGGGE